MSLAMTEIEFAFWLEHSSPTNQVIYHYGILPRDRTGKLVSGGEIVKQNPTAYSQAVDYVALAAWQAMREHYVLLTQRRLNEFKFEYLATRTAVSFPQTEVEPPQTARFINEIPGRKPTILEMLKNAKEASLAVDDGNCGCSR